MTATHPQRPEPADLRVGGYRLLAKIGEGGMGVVHLAQAPDGARVALKVLRPHIIGDDEARERLAREVASLRRVSSPRIAEIIDADPWGDTPFVATRYVPGLSLHQHVREHGPIRGDDLRWFAAGLAEAVIAVHQVGVLHRDIKPSNVLLEGRSPVLIDFGLARLAEDPRLTHTGWLLGTPGYLAPEILYGEDATTASDVHAWAATVAFAATGRPPFGTGPAMAIMDRVRRGEHDLTGVPTDLLALVRQGLAPEAADRPSTGALLATLRGRVEEPTLPWMLADAASSRSPVPGPTPTRLLSRPARTPYQQPPPPRPVMRPRLVPEGFVRTDPVARLQRALIGAGGFLIVAFGFGVAPYVTTLAMAALALTVRTLSWTTEAARERQHLRGRRRWYDPMLTVCTSPWYLLVATGGTVMLVLWAGLVGAVVGAAVLLVGVPVSMALLVVGAVLSLGMWWGPAAKRVRLPVRRAVAAASHDPWVGWTVVAAEAILLAAVVYAFLTGEATWTPWPGPPWRNGTLLGDLVRWI